MNTVSECKTLQLIIKVGGKSLMLELVQNTQTQCIQKLPIKDDSNNSAGLVTQVSVTIHLDLTH